VPVNAIRRVWGRLPWYGASSIVAAGAAGIAGFAFVFTSDLFNEECLNERNLLSGEFERSNCGEGARVARTEAPSSEASPSAGATDIPMDAEGSPSPQPTATPEPAETAAPPGPSPTPTVAAAESGVLLRGDFQDGDPGHDGSGMAEVQRLADGSLNVFLSNFSVTNGPDLFVVLTRDPGGEYEDGDLVLEGLRANNGNQNYALPPGTDVTLYGAVLIWCRSFDVEFAFATLRGVE